MPDKAVKITIRNGKLKRTFTLTAPPFPKVGDIVNIKGAGGADWTVERSVPTEVIVAFSTSGGKLRQVFP